MTAIIKTGTPDSTQHLVPSTTNTLERLLMWCLLLYFRLNQNKDVLLADNSTNKRIAFQRFIGQDGNLYMGFTCFLAIDPDYDTLPNKPWEYAVELNNAVAGASYNS
jgi:hypothetical protein